MRRLSAATVTLALASSTLGQASAQTPAPPAQPAYITSPDWETKPDGQALSHLYPPYAADHEIAARTVMRCTVKADGALTSCFVVKERPLGYGFGRAALQTAPYFRMRPKTVNGAPVSGARVDIPLTWLLETPVRHEMVVETPGVATPPSSDREWEADYAEPVQAVGEQGVVWVRAKVGLDGVPSNVTVRDSARSLALDRAAVAALAEWRFTPARNAAGQPMAATIAVKFEFETPDLRTKTCAALTAHAAWVARAWPERRIADFPLYRNGRAYASTYLREWKKYGGEVAFDTKYAAAFAWTLKACTAQPDAKFVDVLASGFTDTPD